MSERDTVQGLGSAEDDRNVHVNHSVRNIRRRRFIKVISAYLCVMHLRRNVQKIPKHTSILTSEMWMKEMWTGNVARFHEQFRMSKTALSRLIHIMRNTYGFMPFKHVAVDQSLGMFLQVLGHGLTFPLVTERFQHSGHTVSCHFHEVLQSICQLGDDIISPIDPDFKDLHPHIANNNKYKDAFSGCIGAVDGCHIMLRMGEVDVVPWRNRKGVTSTNCLAVVDFDTCFTFAKVGIEGSMHDSRILYRALRDSIRPFPIPPQGKYYLADAGYPNIKGFLIPYSKTRYHLPDFRQAGAIRGRDENFNYLHSSLRSVVERTFGIWKTKWRILENMARFPKDVQLKIIWATMALHNYVRRHDRDEEYLLNYTTCDNNGGSSLDIDDTCSWNPVRPRESNEMNILRDHIRDTMMMHEL